MLFRTKFFLAYAALTAVAISTALLLIVSTQRNDANHLRSSLAHESLSGYFQLSASVFRTFKQARRDLISGDGSFAFDFGQAAQDITVSLNQIDATLRREAALAANAPNLATLADLTLLRHQITAALTEIDSAAQMIRRGEIAAGREKAVAVLQGQVDVKIATLIQAATTAQRAELGQAQSEIRRMQSFAQATAWAAMLIAIFLSAAIFLTLLRRLQIGLRALDMGAKAIANNDLAYQITLPGRDEFSAVAQSFTTMAQQIQVKQDALEAAKQELEQRVAERTAALTAALAELRESDTLRRQFFADIGHELRTPVSAIRGEAEVALRSKSARPAAQAAALRTIVSITEELTTTVSDLFLIAREMAGVLDFRAEQVNLAHAVALGVEQMQSLSLQREASIAVDLGHGEILIHGDRGRLAQLVRILIGNALEHAPGSVAIKVAVARQDGQALLSVCDDGPGIAEQDWPRIFERFVKGSERRQTGRTGTGLGLAIARSITAAHGGTIAVQRSTAGGAKLLACFPLIEEPAAR